MEIIASQIIWDTVHIHGPAYPMLLAAFYKIFSFSLPAVRFMQLLIGLLCFLPLFYSLKKLCAKKDGLVPYLFLGIAAFYMPLIFYQAELISETLLVPLLCLTVALLYLGESKLELPGGHKTYLRHLWWFASAGLAAGLAAATHPMALIFIAAESVLLFIIDWKTKAAVWKKLLPASCFIFFALAVIAPVSIHNSIISGRLVLIQHNSGLNLFIGNNPDATGTCYVRPGPQWNSLHSNAAAEAEALNVSKDHIYSKRTLDFICRRPVQWLSLLLKKAVYVWNWRELISGADTAPLRYFTPLQRYSAWMSGGIMALSLAGLALAVSQRRTIYCYRHFILLAVAFWLGQTLTVTSGRYRLAMLPALFVFAAFLIARIIAEQRNLRNYLMPLAYCGIAGLIVYLPSPPVNQINEQAESDSLMGEAYFKQNSYPAAEKHLIAALKTLDDRARCLNMLGVIAEKKEDFGAAARYFMDAVKSDPESPEGYMNLAINASNIKDFELAEKLFAQALNRGSAKPDVLYNYAFYLQRRGNIPLAEKYYQLCLKEAPYDRRALNAMGIIAMSKKAYKDAIVFFSRALSIVPGNSGMMLNLAAANASDGRTEKALEIVQDVLAHEPENRNALIMRQMLTRVPGQP